MDFKQKTICITGGCSGIGRIMAEKALKRGAAKLIIIDINEAALAETAKLFSSYKADILTIQADLADLTVILRAAAQIKSTGAVDILINNAGVVTGKYFHEHSHENIRASMLINANALMHLTLELLPAMMERNSGAICNICSSAGLISNPKMAVYAASKWAAVGWSDSLRLEMKQLNKNISVTTIMPFFINTGMFDGVRSKLLPILEPEPVSERILKAIEKERKLVAMPLPYWFIRLAQGLLPLPVFEWVMRDVFGIYDTMKHFTGRNKSLPRS